MEQLEMTMQISEPKINKFADFLLEKEQLALCIETIACTGIRISEIRHFTVERIKTGKIEIYNKGKYRRIFLSQILRKKYLHIVRKMRSIKDGCL